MIRSRVTFATIDAAAMLAATMSPFFTPSAGHGIFATGNPSVNT